MPYNPESVQQIMAFHGRWVTTTNFFDFIKLARSSNPSVATGRAQILEAFNAMTPYDLNPATRFPERELLINLYAADWPSKIEQLLGSLAWHDRPAEVAGQGPDRRAASDAAKSFWAITTRMVTQALAGTGVYSRQSFETNTPMPWTD